MIIYVNGDSHSAGAEIQNSYCFAKDDPLYHGLGRKPHPDNIPLSYGCIIANMFRAIFDTDAESASSNDRIIRTTKQYLESNTPDLIIIGWSTWEREEWLLDGVYWQINAGGIGDDWPQEIKNRYPLWIKNIDHAAVERAQHEKIWQLHQELKNKNIPHLFFNSYLSFKFTQTPYDWGDNYIAPYDNNYTYYHWLSSKGYHTVYPDSYHYGSDAHYAWAEFLIPHLTKLL